MAQGKKRLRRGARKRIDWNAIVRVQFAAWKLGRPLDLEAAVALSQDEREAIQREADALRLAAFNKRKAERGAAWAAWHRSKDPNKALTWAGHCQGIGRVDLYRNECLSDFRTGKLIDADGDYAGT